MAVTLGRARTDRPHDTGQISAIGVGTFFIRRLHHTGAALGHNIAYAILAGPGPLIAAALIQATYDGAPGHPVLIGRSHGGPLAATLTGDTGARVYLRDQGALRIECSDLWSGHDIDH